jgi:outer membrane protein assembly factor BamB
MIAGRCPAIIRFGGRNRQAMAKKVLLMGMLPDVKSPAGLVRHRTLSIGLGLIALVLVAGCGRPAIPATPELSSPQQLNQSVAAVQTLAADWPGWRGHNGDGLAPGKVPATWDESTNVVWKTKIPGRGHGSPVIIGDQIFLETADDAAQIQSVIAVSRRGKLRWQTDLHTGHFETEMHRENTHASSTLASDGTCLFAVFLNDHRVWCSALTLEGEEQWRTEVGGFRSKFGYSASPAVYRQYVIVAGDHDDGGFVAALDRADGHLCWRRKRPAHASWCTPRVVRLAGKDQLVLCGGNRVIAYDPETGDELWNVAGTAGSTVGSAVVSGDLVIVSGGFPEKDTVALKADGTVAWRIKEKCYVPSLLVHDGMLYMIQDEGGIARCFDAATGKERWRHRVGGNFRTSPLLCDGKIYITDMAGKSTVFAANPERFEFIAENQLGTEGFSSPAVSENQLFLRVPFDERGRRQEWLYCIAE